MILEPYTANCSSCGASKADPFFFLLTDYILICILNTSYLAILPLRKEKIVFSVLCNADIGYKTISMELILQ